MSLQNKWNDYEIGSISWINSRRERLAGCPFIEYAIKQPEGCFVVEIGGGELVEAQKIRNIRGDLHYYVYDISDTFIEYAKEKGFEAFKKTMNDINVNGDIDVIYMNHVIEHSPDIKKTVEMLKNTSYSYYITMFKWRFKTGDLESYWCGKKGYWSTEYNIWALLALFGDSVDDIYITDEENNKIDWLEYQDANKDLDLNRNGKYLNIIGRWK